MTEHLNITEFYEKFPNEQTCREYSAHQRWQDSPACPRCGSTKVWQIKGGMGYKCGDCPPKTARFSVRTGTVMEHSRLPLQKWLLAINLLTDARKGISSIQFAKVLGVQQKTAWFLEHRIREACKSNGPMLFGEVEVDEAYIGGKEANRHTHQKLNAGRDTVGQGASDGTAGT